MLRRICDRFTYPPEEASPPDVTHIGVVAEVFVQECLQEEAAFADVRYKVVLPDDALDLKRRGAAYRVALVRVPVGESTGSTRQLLPRMLGVGHIP